MNRIFIDVGNSRIKYAVSEDGHYEYLGAELVQDFLANIEQSLFAEVNDIDEVYFSTVGSLQNLDELTSAIQQHWNIIPTQLNAQRSCCGLTSGYADFHKLGSDRWLAMQGALAITTQPFIVVDAGTALTIDAVIDGQHKGGFIVPGLSTMHNSLATGTALLEMPTNNDLPEDMSQNLLANNTASAVLAGTLYMSAAFVNQVVVDLNQQLQTQFKLFLTGGDAAQLASLLDYQYSYIPDLVLHGMCSVVESVKKS
ncbi:type III pantothenate kinase [Thiosulfatimonas sediminis]|uniref:Type III pantothenate kinase n=1 Tax=Thiosulfatimonas sediminis TaxID=2675054 RepID=A0A6F8PYB0_9GAMM|nr:type III pantothenate kinase [Thiosulfatimonas sediminis]BBP46950.1 type III pantothenate kinase [Thiosulfatimonas sediminis]